MNYIIIVIIIIIIVTLIEGLNGVVQTCSFDRWRLNFTAFDGLRLLSGNLVQEFK